MNQQFVAEFIIMLMVHMNAVWQGVKKLFIDIEMRHFIDRQVIGR